MVSLSKRRTWVCFFLLSSSWSLLLSIRSWYTIASPASALYASVLYGAIFSLLSMGVALTIAVPTTLVTWITILVLLAFVEKPHPTLVMEGCRVIADISSISVNILLHEGNIVVSICIAASFFAQQRLIRGFCLECVATEEFHHVRKEVNSEKYFLLTSESWKTLRFQGISIPGYIPPFADVVNMLHYRESLIT